MNPESPDTALLLIDVINDMDFPGSENLLEAALPAARRIAALKAALRQQKIPAIYVNDNFGHWQCDFNQQIRRCLEPGSPGREVAELLLPGENDYFVLKPMHSGFYSTSLEVLLKHLKTRTLILTGFATDICVVYTANDAYMRGFNLIVPSDCVAAESETLNRTTLTHIRDRLKANIQPSPHLFDSPLLLAGEGAECKTQAS